MNGRDKCPECGSRDTERLATSTRKATTLCHTCANEWYSFIGPECPKCGSNNTKRKMMGSAPHRTRKTVCYECGFNT
jgi:predicted RNA-binding Zn-ribbon protein involved in translation (DUF1610 family)